MTTHSELALGHIARVASVRERMRDIYAEALETGSQPDRNTIGQLHGHIGDSLKLAEVHATLAVAQAVEQLGLAL